MSGNTPERRSASPQGARVHPASGEKIDARGYPVEFYNIPGAGIVTKPQNRWLQWEQGK